MEYNGIHNGLMLMLGDDLMFVPSVQAGYGPYQSFNAARTGLIDTFEDIANIPRGFTFCVIENNKPQEYWFTAAGDWDTVEKKNSGSGTATNIALKIEDNYLYVSYQNGNPDTWQLVGKVADDVTITSTIKMRSNNSTGYIEYSNDNVNWYPLVSIDTLRGYNGQDGKQGPIGPQGPQGPQGPEGPQGKPGTGVRILGSFNDVSELPATGEPGDGYLIDGDLYVYVGTGNGDVDTPSTAWRNVGTIQGPEGPQGPQGPQGPAGNNGVSTARFKSICFKRWNPDEHGGQNPTAPPRSDGTFEDPVARASGWSDGIPAGEAQLWMTTRWFFSVQALTDNSDWTTPQWATDTADIDIEYSNAPLDTDLNTLGYPYTSGHIYPANPNGWYDASEYPALLEGANWQAIRIKKNGVWGNWDRYKIRGESGAPGISPAAVFKSFVFRRSNSIMSSADPEYDASRANEIRLPSNEWPTGGTYISPIPTNTEEIGGEQVPMWHDGIPPGEGRIWEAVRTFKSNEDNDTEWSEPVWVRDTETLDKEWCDIEDLAHYMGGVFMEPSRRSPDDANPDKIEGDPWYDEPDDAPAGIPHGNPVWCAERKISNGEYAPGSSWFVYRIKGEKGTNGTSIHIKGTLFGVYRPYDLDGDTAAAYFLSHYNDLFPKDIIYAIFGEVDLWDKLYSYAKDGNDVVATDITDTLVEGDIYLFDGDGYCWNGDHFVNVGPIQGPEGPEGKAQYVHIKYSNDPLVLTNPAIAQFTDYGGEEPGAYVGIRVDEYPDDDPVTVRRTPADYKWHAWDGEDGWGYEYIFTLTSKDSVDADGNPIPPDVPVHTTSDPLYSSAEGSAYQRNDFVPDAAHGYTVRDWYDNPPSPYKAMPFCWVAYRQKIDGKWTVFKGSAQNPAKASIFSMFTSNGRGIESVTELYAVATFGDQATLDNMTPAQLETFKRTFTEAVPDYDPDNRKIYLWNYEVITYDDDSTPVETRPSCIGTYASGRSIKRIYEYYYANSSDQLASLPDYQYYLANNRFKPNPDVGAGNHWNNAPQVLSKDKIYLWNYEVVEYKQGTVPLTDEEKYDVTVPVIIAYYVYTDIEYLTTIFKKVEGDSNTAYLGGLIGAVEKNSQNNDVVRAMLNATDKGEDQNHGKLFIASGMNGIVDPDTGDFSADNATFKVFEDGHVEARDIQVIDADIQGFLRQYFYREHDIVTNLLGTIATTTKMVNCMQLGWSGLSFVEDNVAVTYDDSNTTFALGFLTSLPAGRIILTNEYYTLKDGTTYANTKFKRSRLMGQFLTMNGGRLHDTTGRIDLCRGWVEVLHIVCKDKNYNTIDIKAQGTVKDKFIVLGYGGTVQLSGYGDSYDDVVDSNGVLLNTSFSVLEPSTVYKPGSWLDTNSTNIESNIVRVHPSNRYIDLFTNTTSDVYVVLPKWGYMQDNTQGGESYVFQINHQGNLRFKVEDLDADTPVSNISLIDNAYFINTSSNVDMYNGKLVCSGVMYIRITRIGQSNGFLLEKFPTYTS